jgi:hypothetical protein
LDSVESWSHERKRPAFRHPSTVFHAVKIVDGPVTLAYTLSPRLRCEALEDMSGMILYDIACCGTIVHIDVARASVESGGMTT